MTREELKKLISESADFSAMRFLARAGRPMSKEERDRLELTLALLFIGAESGKERTCASTPEHA
jgi:hypothetical protein